MFKILSLVFVSFAVTGCASVSKKPIDAQCDQIGMYARSVVTLRDIGVSLNDIDTYSSKPVIVNFPFQRIRQDAYKLKTRNPADAYMVFYQKCVSDKTNLIPITPTKEIPTVGKTTKDAKIYRFIN